MANDTGEQFPRSALADALFGATQQRVLGFLFGQPSRSFFTTELMSLVGSGRGVVQRELQKLERSGLVTVRMMGNQKHYQAAAEAPIYEELCSIIRKTVGLQEPLRDALSELDDRLQVAILYGSTVKGTDTAGSDIDVLIVSDSLTLEDAIRVFAPVESFLDRRINCSVYSVVEFAERRRNSGSFINRVLDESHVVLAGSLDG
jgi:predicted nucleotidyltransferase